MKVFNTLSGTKEEFSPAHDPVRIYVCGVTPYADTHLGHAMSYIVFDVIRRYLEFRGYHLRYVQNFTDIDDKIIARAQALGVSPQTLAEDFIEEYFEGMDALNIKRADRYPRATQEIPKMVEVISGLIEKGYAYAADGDVYFRVSRFAEYGKLSHRSLEGMMAGARIEVGQAKEHPMDFALWKAAKPGEPAWESPWGPGRPGWHIECSAMALSYLGETLDIHGGGADLVFPHHENETAQSEAFTGKPFVRYWLHNGLLQMGEEKMSKSLGNLVTVREALSRYSADAIRLFVLSSHYRNPLTYREEALSAAERGAERLRGALRPSAEDATIRQGFDRLRPAAQGGEAELDASPHRRRFIEAMDDDFNTSQAIASLFDLAREINRGRDEGKAVAAAQAILRELAGVLGLTLRGREDDRLGAASFIELLMETRAELRAARRYDLADRIRARLSELGVALEDTPQGTVWKWRTELSHVNVRPRGIRSDAGSF